MAFRIRVLVFCYDFNHDEKNKIKVQVEILPSWSLTHLPGFLHLARKGCNILKSGVCRSQGRTFPPSAENAREKAKI